MNLAQINKSALDNATEKNENDSGEKVACTDNDNDEKKGDAKGTTVTKHLKNLCILFYSYLIFFLSFFPVQINPNRLFKSCASPFVRWQPCHWYYLCISVRNKFFRRNSNIMKQLYKGHIHSYSATVLMAQIFSYFFFIRLELDSHTE